MRNNMMRKIIMGAFFPPVFLLLINTNRECEASAVIADSRNVSHEDTNMGSNDDSTNSSTTPPPLQLDSVAKAIPHNEALAQQQQQTKPCPSGTNHSIRSDEPTNGPASNHENDSVVKDHETALEKISGSIAGVFSTLKHSVESIFSPGSGVGRNGEMDCAHNNTSSGSNVTLEDTNATTTTGVPVPQDDDQKLAEERLLIHLVSSNDTNNNTNVATSTTSTSTLSPLPDLDKQ